MGDFRYFVVLAGMRTGSNFLEASLNQFPKIFCLGELFNPVFVGHHNTNEAFGISLEDRERDPFALITRLIEQTDGLPGFRLFHDHDARIISHVLNDPTCAKISLTRDFVDSYVSLKIAAETGQWRLSNVNQRKSAVVRFVPEEFEEQRRERIAFSRTIDRSLKYAGQSAFHLIYDDLSDPAVLNGLAKYLGSGHEIKSPAKSLKRQNPSDLSEKVSNYSEMTDYLSRSGQSEAQSSDWDEPKRGPGVKRFVTAQEAPLLFVPVPGAPDQSVREWLAALDGVAVADLPTGYSQKTLRDWRRAHPGHRSFTVLRHPLERAHAVFCDCFSGGETALGPESLEVLKNRYDVAIPTDGKAQSLADHKAAFAGFLKFLKKNLAGQTSLGIDPRWGTQMASLQAASQVILPDQIIRETDMALQLSQLARSTGCDKSDVSIKLETRPFDLDEIYDDQLEKRAFDAYRKDYIQFGFANWR